MPLGKYCSRDQVVFFFSSLFPLSLCFPSYECDAMHVNTGGMKYMLP